MVKRITFKERERIEKLLNKNKNIAQIALRLERPRTTLVYEIKKGSKNGIYSADFAQSMVGLPKESIVKGQLKVCVKPKPSCYPVTEKPKSKKKSDFFKGNIRFSLTIPKNLLEKIDQEREKTVGFKSRNQMIVEKLQMALIKSPSHKGFAKAN